MTRSIDGVVGRPTVGKSMASPVAAPLSERVPPEWSRKNESARRQGSPGALPRVNALESPAGRVSSSQKTLSADTPAHPRTQNTNPQQPIRRQFAKPLAPTNSRRTLPQWLQMPLIIGGAMLAGLAMQNVVFGQLGIIAYGAAALMLGIPSRTSFILALLSMLATTGLLVFKGDVALSQNFAVYTFLLLVVGVITLNRELKKEGGRIYSRRIRN